MLHVDKLRRWMFWLLAARAGHASELARYEFRRPRPDANQRPHGANS